MLKKNGELFSEILDERVETDSLVNITTSGYTTWYILKKLIYLWLEAHFSPPVVLVFLNSSFFGLATITYHALNVRYR